MQEDATHNYIEIDSMIDLNNLVSEDKINRNLMKDCILRVFEHPLLDSILENDVLKRILAQIEKSECLDFQAIKYPDTVFEYRLEMENAKDEKEATYWRERLNKLQVKDKEMAVIVCNNLLKFTNELGFPIRRVESIFYIFDGICWKIYSNDLIQIFLAEVASVFGVDEIRAQCSDFQELLLQQFQTATKFSFPSKGGYTVKVNLKNGTFVFDGKQWELRTFDYNDYLTYCLPFVYDEGAEAPQFDKFLSRCFPGDEIQNFIAECFGYCLGGTYLNLEKAFFFYGSGANGKSVLCRIMEAMFGEENVSHVSLPDLCDQSGTSIPELAGKIANFCTETDWNKFNESKFKALISGEKVTSKKLYENPIQSAVSCKFIFCLNNIPTRLKSLQATIRRCSFIECKVIIPEEERDSRLAEKIIETELPGIFNWVLKGLERLLKRGRFDEPKSVREATENVKLSSLAVKLFLDDENWSSDSENKVLLKELYRQYVVYANSSGYKPLPKNVFSEQLRDLDFRVDRSSRNQTYVWCKQSFSEEEQKIQKNVEEIMNYFKSDSNATNS